MVVFGRVFTHLKAERGGGGGFGTEEPPHKAMMAINDCASIIGVCFVFGK
jgi:hypothetical protein